MASIPYLTPISFVVGILVVVWGIRDALSFSAAEFAAVGRRRRDWVLVQLAVGPLGTLIWFGAIRRDLLDPSRAQDEMLLVDET